MAEAVSVCGLRGGTHSPTGHALERVLGFLVLDSGLCGTKAEERPMASDGEPTATAVLVERISQAGGPVFGNPEWFRSVTRTGSPTDHREYPFAGIH